MTTDLATAVAEKARAFRMVRGVQTDVMEVKLLDVRAKAPTYGSDGAAGMDIYACDVANATCIPAGGYGLVKTGISVAVPRGHYARLAPRSGLAWNNGIDVLAGVVDEDYRGEVGVILINHGRDDFIVKVGDRIAQLIVEKYTPCLAVMVEELDSTGRGAGGFGSTGK